MRFDWRGLSEERVANPIKSDVFFSYNWRDHAVVEAVARQEMIQVGLELNGSWKATALLGPWAC